MSGILEIGGALLDVASRRMEVAAQNISNMATPGYRSKKIFIDYMDMGNNNLSINMSGKLTADFSPGKLVKSDNKFDLAISGDGWFRLRSGDNIFYSRNGQFSRDEDGRLSDATGAVLQSEAGDLIIRGQMVVERDGTVLDDGEPVARIAIASFSANTALTPSGGGYFSADASIQPVRGQSQVLQAMLETSNVSTGQEMLSLMQATRNAETGQRIVQTYDDLIGRVLNSIGQLSA